MHDYLIEFIRCLFCALLCVIPFAALLYCAWKAIDGYTQYRIKKRDEDNM